MEHLAELGVGGILCMLILQTVLPYFKERLTTGNEDCTKAEATLNEIAASTQAMSAILVKTDSDGLPLCYTPRSLTTAIENLATGIERLSDKVERLN